MSEAMVPQGSRPIDKVRALLSAPAMREQLERAVGAHADGYAAAILSLVSGSADLQACNPVAVAVEAMKAAVLQLSLDRSLGQAWVVPRKGVPQFQIGWRGWVQLALRSGQYRRIHVAAIKEGERVIEDRATGEIRVEGKPTGERTIGVLAFLRLHNGYEASEYWTADRLDAHRNRYVKGKGGAWESHPDEMRCKTVLAHLLRTRGILSVEMQSAAEAEREPEPEATTLPWTEPDPQPLPELPPTQPAPEEELPEALR